MSELFEINPDLEVRSVQVGAHQVVFIDDFLLNPQALREAAARATFTPYPGLNERKGYPGVRAPVPLDYSLNLTALAEPLIRLNFQVPEDLPLHKSECAFSLTTLTPEALGPLQRVPHFDASTPNHMAVLLYLCNESHGGTAFYRHRATGLQQITRDNCEHYLDVFYAELNARPPRPRYFDASDEHFDFLGMMPAKFNRLVAYRGSLLHSARVNPALSISGDPLRGRLTANTFYDFGLSLPSN